MMWSPGSEVKPEEKFQAPRLRPTAVLHQEGFFALLALTAIYFRTGDPLSAMRPATSLGVSLTVGAVCGLLIALADLLVSHVPAATVLESFQREMVAGWTFQDILAVALLSGLAEEALMRVFLQSWIGILPAAMVFGILHLLPDRRLWFWPFAAFVMGILLGLLYEYGGYPAAALAHILVNILSFARLLRPGRKNPKSAPRNGTMAQ